ncbi:glycosyltransferase [Pelomonas sp. V22]|uniref:glycosyltransferase n=1 Tax=Pelomonas sp. V22 TaxID=2822139 RepID=UPI0024A7AE87|nr:glycosyltransferase [Pelomonas sp. V22]MDI4631692.1 glycosyltransferase [Pelomonas sp. V22]
MEARADARLPRRLGLILAGSIADPVPSTRIALLNLLPQLAHAGWEAVPLHEGQPASEQPQLKLRAADIAAQGIRLVIFQKVYGQSAEALARELGALGIPCLFMICDRVVPSMAESCPATVTVTPYLRQLYPADLQSRISVIHDGIEHPEVIKTRWHSGRGQWLRPLRAVLVTSARLYSLPALPPLPAWLRVDVIGDYPPSSHLLERLSKYRLHWQRFPAERQALLRQALNPHIRTLAWDAQGVYEHLCEADLAIIPIDRQPPLGSMPPPGWSVKSENRLSLKMSVGLPVIATRIPSYEPVIEQGVNGFLADTPTDWLAALTELRDPRRRREIGAAARASVVERFSVEAQAKALQTLLEQLDRGRQQP